MRLSVRTKPTSILTGKTQAYTLATSRRILFYRPALTGYELASISYAKISMIEHKKRIFDDIEIINSGEPIKIYAITDGDVNGFVQYVSSKI